MVKDLSISNYKSIRHLDLLCKKLNVFIGEPNSGKSNIIEALSLLAQGVLTKDNFKDVIRFKTIGDLFFDSNINKSISVKTDILNGTLSYSKTDDGNLHNQFKFILSDPTNINKERSNNSDIYISHDGSIGNYVHNIKMDFLYYAYKRLSNFEQHYLPHLAPPYGNNLPGILLANPELRKWVSDFFKSKGFKIGLKPTENEIYITKVIDEVDYSYPYLSISETLQRVIFYMMAMESNKNKILLLDEPDSNTFPFYTKFLGERMALDETNQFFVTTHNPYLLLNLIEKSSFDNINVCVVQMKKYETVLTVLNENQISQVLDFNSDVFLNLDKLTEA
jgi:AAA15 family ATPase/GTPase